MNQFKPNECSDYDSILIRWHTHVITAFIFCFKTKVPGNKTKYLTMAGYKSNKNHSFKEPK